MGAACQSCAKVGTAFPNIRPSSRFQVFKEVHRSACCPATRLWDLFRGSCTVGTGDDVVYWGRAVYEGEHQPHQCCCSNTGAERFELGLSIDHEEDLWLILTLAINQEQFSCFLLYRHLSINCPPKEETVIKFLSKVKLFQRLPKENLMHSS